MLLTGLACGATVVRVLRILLAMAAIVALQTPSPWVGTWKLNPSKSIGISNSQYKRVTLTIEPWRDGLKVVYDMVGIRGGVTHVEWTGRFDNKDYPLQGIDYVMTNAYSPIDDRSYNIVIKREGRISGNVQVMVSADGRTLTAITSGKNAQGQDASTTAIYDRVN
jgi:hypothetical protein